MCFISETQYNAIEAISAVFVKQTDFPMKKVQLDATVTE